MADVEVYWSDKLRTETGADGRYDIGGFGGLSGTVTFSREEFATRTFVMPDQLPEHDSANPNERIEMNVNLERR